MTHHKFLSVKKIASGASVLGGESRLYLADLPKQKILKELCTKAFLGLNKWASLVAQQERIRLPSRRRGFDPWVEKIPRRRKLPPNFAWEIP